MKRLARICIVICLTGIVYFYVKTVGATENPGKGILFSDLAVRNRLQESLLVESQYEKIMCRLQSDNDETEESFIMGWPATEAEYVPNVNSRSAGTAYICWENLLVVESIVYKRESDIYKKQMKGCKIYLERKKEKISNFMK